MRNFLIIALTLLLSTTAYAGVPLSFTVNGLLREDGALVNKSVSMSFSIIDDNSRLIAEKKDAIPVENGLYTVIINDIDSAKVATADKLYLKITVDEVTLEPILPITAVPYAISSKVAENLKTAPIEGGGIYRFNKGELDSQTDEGAQKCPCDHNQMQFECGNSFEHQTFDQDHCYDEADGAYRYYNREPVRRPLEVLAIEGATIAIGTTEPDAPITILSDNSENGGADIHISGPNPTILLENSSNGTSGTLTADYYSGTAAKADKANEATTAKSADKALDLTCENCVEQKELKDIYAPRAYGKVIVTHSSKSNCTEQCSGSQSGSSCGGTCYCNGKITSFTGQGASKTSDTTITLNKAITNPVIFGNASLSGQNISVPITKSFSISGSSPPCSSQCTNSACSGTDSYTFLIFGD